jgi:mRNA interferase MazF
MAAHRRKKGAEAHPRRGEIYLTRLDPTVGHEIKKTRPALIIQNDTDNEYRATTMIAPITSTVRIPLSPVHVLVQADLHTGLTVPSAAVFNEIRTVDRVRLTKRLGIVDAETMTRVDEAVHIAFGLEP